MNIQSDRLIGSYSSNIEGPLLVISAGVHGNEPSGVLALEKVFTILKEEKPNVKGRIVGIYGNQPALQKEVRYINEDLNRTWTIQNIEQNVANTVEKQQMFDIIKTLQRFPQEKYTNSYFLDCHTTSSDSLPYISVQDKGDNDDWAHSFPTHIIRGFSDIVSGCIDHYLTREQYTGFVFEGGQHTSEDALVYHEGMIWMAIQKACQLDLEDLNSTPKSISYLKQQKTQQKTFEILYRHEIQDEDHFEMIPGFHNFQSISKGELLATHNKKEIRSQWDAFIFMPLYQSQGNDGFFVIEDVSA